MLEIFNWHPERIAVVAVLFVVGYLVLRSIGRFRAWPLLVAGGAWALWIPWEANCKATGANIRVDLFLLIPFLLIVTGWAVIAAFRPKARTVE